MAAPTTLKIDDVEYVRKDAVPDTEGDIKIVVPDRGFVYVGYVSREDDFIIIIKNAKTSASGERPRDLANSSPAHWRIQSST